MMSTPTAKFVPPLAPSFGSDPVRVLLVDDEDQILEEMQECLEAEEINCTVAHNAQEALDLIRELPDLDAVITDIRMPGMDGLEFTRTLKRKAATGSALAVIILTGHAGYDEAVEALQAGAEDFLSKPVSASQLIYTVTKAVELTRLRRTEEEYRQLLADEVQHKTNEAEVLRQDIGRKQVELTTEQLSRAVAVRSKEEFFALISHDLRTPLILLRAFASRIKGHFVDTADREREEETEFMMRVTSDALEYLDTVLEIAKITNEGDTPDQNNKGFLVQDAFQRLEVAFGKKLQEKDIRPKIEVTSGLKLSGDCRQIIRAVGALLDNAIKNSKPGATIIMRGEDDPSRTVLSVRDEGPGMSEEEIRLASQPFGHLENEWNENTPRQLMLGLPLARIFSEGCGGELVIESEPDWGTTASIILPK
jgi:CheY-like chemotaxis protein